MRLIAKAIRISRAKFHCNRLTTVQNIYDYASLIFATYFPQDWCRRRAGRIAVRYGDLRYGVLYSMIETGVKSVRQRDVVDTVERLGDRVRGRRRLLPSVQRHDLRHERRGRASCKVANVSQKLHRSFFGL